MITTLKRLITGTDEPREMKPIEFVYYVSSCDLSVSTNFNKTPSDFDNIINCGTSVGGSNLDILICWNNDCKTKATYFGHWNDGVK